MLKPALAAGDQKEHVFKLLSGHVLPAVGLGTWKLASQAYDSVQSAIVEGGYRHIDTAWKYGIQNEVGRALKASMQVGLERRDLFITSKLCCTDSAPKRARPALKNTHEELGLDYLDLYFIHWPFCLKDGASGPPKPGMFWNLTWKGFGGKWRSLLKINLFGICNFTVKKLDKLLSFAQIMPSVCQMHPAWRNDKILEACKKNGIHVNAYSPLGSSEGGIDHIHNQTVDRVVNKSNKTPAQVLLKWAHQRGASVIPRSSNPQRIKENIDVFSREIAEDDFRAISNLHYQKKGFDSDFLFVNKEAGPSRSVADLWDNED